MLWVSQQKAIQVVDLRQFLRSANVDWRNSGEIGLIVGHSGRIHVYNIVVCISVKRGVVFSPQIIGNVI